MSDEYTIDARPELAKIAAALIPGGDTNLDCIVEVLWAIEGHLSRIADASANVAVKTQQPPVERAAGGNGEKRDDLWIYADGICLGKTGQGDNRISLYDTRGGLKYPVITIYLKANQSKAWPREKRAWASHLAELQGWVNGLQANAPTVQGGAPDRQLNPDLVGALPYPVYLLAETYINKDGDERTAFAGDVQKRPDSIKLAEDIEVIPESDWPADDEIPF